MVPVDAVLGICFGLAGEEHGDGTSCIRLGVRAGALSRRDNGPKIPAQCVSDMDSLPVHVVLSRWHETQNIGRAGRKDDHANAALVPLGGDGCVAFCAFAFHVPADRGVVECGKPRVRHRASLRWRVDGLDDFPDLSLSCALEEQSLV